MFEAMTTAELGDEQLREDPTVDELQRRAAELLGQDAALFLPTATMANQIALKLHGRPGDVLVAEETAHVVIYEYGGTAAHAGLMTLGLPGHCGRLTPEQVSVAAEPSTKVADQRVTVLALEDTHNSSGGRVWPLDELDAVVSTARRLELRVHLDGARLLNAATALGVEPEAISARFDTVTLCLSKGLGCPLGALLAGSEQLMERAWREKHLFGGAMRQAGIVAAAGLYALDHNRARLAQDHANARLIAERLAGMAGIVLDLATVQTNIVIFRLGPDAPDAAAVVARARERGVLVSAFAARTVRLVTHLNVDRDQCEHAADVLAAVL